MLGILHSTLAAAEATLEIKPGQQTAHSFAHQGKEPVNLGYWLYAPKEYGKEATKKWPLLLFLHGSGERGKKLELVTAHGPPKLVGEKKELEEFIIVSPQCPPQQWWKTAPLKDLCDFLQKQLPIDPDRVYVTGLSMGGFGTWSLLEEYPDYWAAAIPICGGGDPRAVEKYRHVPIWIFHGAKDPAVPLQASVEMLEALKKAGAEPKHTFYPDLGHDCWTTAYDSAETWKWLAEQKRQPKSDANKTEPEPAKPQAKEEKSAETEKPANQTK